VLEDTRPRPELSSWAERIVYVSEPVLRKVAGVDSMQGLHGVGVLALPSSFSSLEASDDMAVNWVSSPRRVLVLDGIQVHFWNSYTCSGLLLALSGCKSGGRLLNKDLDLCRGEVMSLYKKLAVMYKKF
jgi:hypothetical protein